MNETSTVEAVHQVFEEVFGLDQETIARATSREDFEEWDSLGHIRLVTALEARFAVSLTVEQIENLHSVQDVADCINKLIG